MLRLYGLQCFQGQIGDILIIKLLWKARKRLNSHGSSRALACGGHYLANSDFGKFEEHLFEKDGVHLSTLGTDIFLSNMSAGLEKFIKHNTPIHY